MSFSLLHQRGHLVVPVDIDLAPVFGDRFFEYEPGFLQEAVGSTVVDCGLAVDAVYAGKGKETIEAAVEGLGKIADWFLLLGR